MTSRTLTGETVSVVAESSNVLRIESVLPDRRASESHALRDGGTNDEIRQSSTIPIVSCEECCELHDCETCLALQHENCDREDCLYCRAQAQKREAQHYCDAQVAYYAKGGFFDTIFDGAFDE